MEYNRHYTAVYNSRKVGLSEAWARAQLVPHMKPFALIVACTLIAAGCGSQTLPGPRSESRSYYLGFASTPPQLEVASVLRTIDEWRPRADAALLPLTPPWRSLLADTSAALLVRREQAQLVQLYRQRGLAIVAMIDDTDGLAREKEAPELVALGRSITEPAVQNVFREYVLAVDSILHPDYLALAMETNLIRVAAPRVVYDALRAMTSSAAQALRSQQTRAKLYVSVQVETAWGRLPRTDRYAGVADDLRDFPFIEALGLSSYPFLGGFEQPEDVPGDYYARIANDARMPVLVVEGGWSSGSVTSVTSTPDKQARYIARQMRLADSAHAVGIFQITYTDLDVSTYNMPPGSILPLFAQLGLVDTEFRAKPALAVWDQAFGRPRR